MKNHNNFLKYLTTLTIFLITCNLFAQTNRYVNDIYNPVTDIYTFSTGSDANPGTPLLPYATINYAISQSTAGDTIYVDAGNYTEQVEINKNLVLIGAGAGATIVISPVTLPLFFTTSANWHPIIYAHDAANIVVKNLTVDGAGRGNSNLRFVGVGYYQTGGSIEDLEIKAVRNTPIDGAQGGTGIVIYSNTGPASTVNVKGNNIYDYQKNGMSMSGAVLTVYVDSNIVTGSGAINVIGQNGVQLSGGATGSITNNTISGISYTPATTVACGVLVFAASSLVITSGNTINDAQAGIYYYQSSGLINNNVISYNAANMGTTPYWYGIDVQNGTTTVSQNTVNGGGNGLGIQADAVSGQTTILNAINNFVDNTDEGFVTRTAGTGVADITIVHNSITNIIGYAIHNYGSTIQQDTCNWYGTDDSTFITNNKISGPVIFIPFLTEGYDNEPATPGFQPCLDCCIEPYVLPVELSSFISTINGSEVTLNWITVTELNNSGFDIERSMVNSHWSKVGNVSGNGTSATPRVYTFKDRGLSSGKYNYRLKQIDFNGNFEYYNLSNEVNVGVPAKFDLSQNYPNPFNPTTKINYDLPFDGNVSMKIFDMSGKEVATLVNEVKTAGYYALDFNGSNLSSGVYYYRISADANGQNFVSTKKMILIK